MHKPRHEQYSDYVIRDGKLVGEFEEMYRDFDDPWCQTTRETFASEKAVVLNLLTRLKQDFGVKSVVELGSGFGHFTARIAKLGLETTGVDVAPTAVAKAQTSHPDLRFLVAPFSDFKILRSLAPDVIVMSEITWYVLDDLRPFIAYIRRELPRTFLLHSLMTYEPGIQTYGREFFTDLDGVLRFFDMRFLESGEVRLPSGGRRTYFLGCWEKDIHDRWLADSQTMPPRPAF